MKHLSAICDATINFEQKKNEKFSLVSNSQTNTFCSVKRKRQKFLVSKTINTRPIWYAYIRPCGFFSSFGNFAEIKNGIHDAISKLIFPCEFVCVGVCFVCFSVEIVNFLISPDKNFDASAHIDNLYNTNRRPRTLLLVGSWRVFSMPLHSEQLFTFVCMRSVRISGKMHRFDA